MAKYIEREKLIDELQHLPEQGELDYLGIYDCVNTTPTADVVKVVRCKDCKHCKLQYPAKPKGEEAIEGYYCYFNREYVKPTHYCSYGVLKECEGK